MIFNLHLLSESDPTARFIGIGAVVVIWIIGLVVQAIKKQQEQARENKPVDLAQGIQQRLPPVQPVSRQGKLQKPPTVPRQNKSRPDWRAIAKPPPKMPKKAGRIVAAPPPILNVQTEPSQVPVVQTMSAAKQMMTGQAAPKTVPFVGSRALNRWLTPATLRQQFIITELLQRPMCDREERS